MLVRTFGQIFKEGVMPLKNCIRPIDPNEPEGAVCGFPVSRGNQHEIGHCPPPRRPGENRRARIAARRAKKKAGEVKIERGGPVSAGSKSAATRARKGAGKTKKEPEAT